MGTRILCYMLKVISLHHIAKVRNNSYAADAEIMLEYRVDKR